MGLLCCCCTTCCLDSLSTKALEIFTIIFHSISSLFLLLSLIIIKWKNIPTVNLVFFLLMFLMNIIMLLFVILIRLWRAKNVIKTTKRSLGNIFSIISIILVIICFIMCLVEEFLIILAFNKADYPCSYLENNEREKNDNYYYNNYYYYRKSSNNTIIEEIRKLDSSSNKYDCDKLNYNYNAHVISNSEYIITYFTLSFLELALIFEIALWIILKRRIFYKTDGPMIPSPREIVQMAQNQVAYDQYGRQVIVVQPGDVVVMGNQQYPGSAFQYPNSNMENYPQNYQQQPIISNQINPQSRDSQRENLSENSPNYAQG